MSVRELDLKDKKNFKRVKIKVLKKYYKQHKNLERFLL